MDLAAALAELDKRAGWASVSSDAVGMCREFLRGLPADFPQPADMRVNLDGGIAVGWFNRKTEESVEVRIDPSGGYTWAERVYIRNVYPLLVVDNQMDDGALTKIRRVMERMRNHDGI